MKSGLSSKVRAIGTFTIITGVAALSFLKAPLYGQDSTVVKHAVKSTVNSNAPAVDTNVVVMHPVMRSEEFDKVRILCSEVSSNCARLHPTLIQILPDGTPQGRKRFGEAAVKLGILVEIENSINEIQMRMISLEIAQSAVDSLKEDAIAKGKFGWDKQTTKKIADMQEKINSEYMGMILYLDGVLGRFIYSQTGVLTDIDQ